MHLKMRTMIADSVRSLASGFIEFYRTYPHIERPSDLRAYYKIQNRDFPRFFLAFLIGTILIQLFIFVVLLFEHDSMAYVLSLGKRYLLNSLLTFFAYVYSLSVTARVEDNSLRSEKDVDSLSHVQSRLRVCGLIPTCLFTLAPLYLVQSEYMMETCEVAWLLYSILQLYLSAFIASGVLYKIVLMAMFNCVFCSFAIARGCFRHLLVIRFSLPVLLFAVYIVVLERYTLENFLLRRMHRRQKDMYQNFMEEIQDPVLILDKSRLLFHNRSASSVLGITEANYYTKLGQLVTSRGLSLDECVRSKFDVIADLASPKSFQQDRYYMEGERAQTGDSFGETTQRERKVMRAAVLDSAATDMTATNGGGKVISVLIHDMTDELHKEEKKAEGKYKNMLLFSLSHELKTPLNIFQGFLSDAKKLMMSTKGMQSSFLQAKGSWRYLRNKINDILDYAQIIAGEFALHLTKFSLSRFIGYLKKTTSFLLTNKVASAVSLDFSIDPRIPEFCCLDRDRLEQVLFNFLSNSAKFTEKGKISLSVSLTQVDPETGGTPKNQLAFAVSDTGCGMSKETLESLFVLAQGRDDGSSSLINVRLFRPKKATKLSGLGLTVSKMICLKMGGDIAVRSEPGCGSTFAFSVDFTGPSATPTSLSRPGPEHGSEEELIPSEHSAREKREDVRTHEFILGLGMLQRANLSTFTPGLVSPAKLSTNDQHRIALVVDDNDFNREVAQRMLRKRGFVTVTAENGLAAVDAIRNLQVGHKNTRVLVFMDVDMPVMDGIEATMAIRKENRQPRPVIVALTAFSAESERQKCFEAGMDAFIDKPLTKERLCELIYNIGSI